MIVPLIKKLLLFVWRIITFASSQLKNLLCWIKRRRKHSGTILPLANHYPAPTDYDIQQSVPSNNEADIQLEPWDNWGVSNIATSPSAPNHHHAQPNACGAAAHQRMMHARRADPESDEDVDYFGDMKPILKKSKKIFVKKSSENKFSELNSGVSNRLAATGISPVQSNELADWDERENAWDEELNEDLTPQANLAIKENKRLEREERHADNQRRKLEKQSRMRSDNFSVIKLT